MAIVWEGNKKQFGTKHESPSVPQNAVKIRDAEGFIGKALPFAIVPMIFCMLAMILKPDVRIYEIALELTERIPEECFFIDNSVRNLHTAAKLGIEPILFNRDNEEYTGTTINSFEELESLIEIDFAIEQ